MQPHDAPTRPTPRRDEDERAPRPQATRRARAPARWRRHRRWRGGQRAGLDRARRGRQSARDGAARGAAPVSGSPLPNTHTIRLVATDGFMSYPGRRTPQGNTTGDFGDPGDGVYSFGFRGADAADLGGADPFTAPIGDLVPLYKGRVHNPAPILAVESDADVFITMSNLGFEGRPDLDDAHTIHWHGFRQQVAIFDGVPEASISVPPLRDFPYYFPTRGVGFEGTYIYHCHFEDTEHVQMGMDGVIFIRPPDTGVKRAYDDPSTAFDREFALLLNEIDLRPHDNLIAVQEFIWSEYDAQYFVINGRSYPDTIVGNGASGAPAVTPDGFPLPLQPVSSRIEANAGEAVLIRLTNLGYYQHSMQLAGIAMTVVGHDATFLTSPYVTNTIDIGPGETRDAIFTAPAHSGGHRSRRLPLQEPQPRPAGERPRPGQPGRQRPRRDGDRGARPRRRGPPPADPPERAVPSHETPDRPTDVHTTDAAQGDGGGDAAGHRRGGGCGRAREWPGPGRGRAARHRDRVHDRHPRRGEHRHRARAHRGLHAHARRQQRLHVELRRGRRRRGRLPDARPGHLRRPGRHPRDQPDGSGRLAHDPAGDRRRHARVDRVPRPIGRGRDRRHPGRADERVRRRRAGHVHGRSHRAGHLPVRERHRPGSPDPHGPLRGAGRVPDRRHRLRPGHRVRPRPGVPAGHGRGRPRPALRGRDPRHRRPAGLHTGRRQRHTRPARDTPPQPLLDDQRPVDARHAAARTTTRRSPTSRTDR